MAENEGSEKTEQATPKRLEEARKKGQVPRSADLSAAIVSLIGAGFLYMFGTGAANEMLAVMRDGLTVSSAASQVVVCSDSWRLLRSIGCRARTCSCRTTRCTCAPRRGRGAWT